jgi:hypothetical protein
MMKKVELDKHKFDTRWRFAFLLALLTFAVFLQLAKAPMANEFIALVIGLAGGGAVQKTI